MKPVRVMQSFGRPRPSTNPYIVQLGEALDAEPGIEHLPFEWRAALLGRFDVLHMHWPEALLSGSSPLRRAGKHAALAALLARVSIEGKPIVRTVHNVELPDVPRPQLALLKATDRLTRLEILINAATRTAAGVPSEVILHGHYRDWFASMPRERAVPGRVAFVGLVRRYKGVEHLLDVFAGCDNPSLTLEIAGRPTSGDIETVVRKAAERDSRVRLDLRHLDEPDLVSAITAAQLVVLPYRFMHNSGSALAALSLDRPVLLPRNDATKALADEVGPGWVHLYDGELTAEALRETLAATASAPQSPPNLAARSWRDAGAMHERAYRRALQLARRRTNNLSSGS